jgi:hypothetical protein
MLMYCIKFIEKKKNFFFLCFRVGENETCINQYDIRDHSDSYPSCGARWPHELPDITSYLRVIEFSFIWFSKFVITMKKINIFSFVETRCYWSYSCGCTTNWMG